jgi:LPXTG-motif cell wall-anchored protein
LTPANAGKATSMQWLVIGGGVALVTALVVLRRRLMDQAGPGRITDHDPVPWDGRPRRATDRRDDDTPAR